ncbi:MAG: hypothetical protein HY548_05840 [Elusimicrobia bacterium]|nr:hypothetical protein [Elusimicrobiota bacterium]
MNQPDVPQDVRRVVLVSRYSTPLAILLVVIGVVASQPVGHVKAASLGLLAFSVLFNILYVRVVKNLSTVKPWMSLVRRLVNLGVNVALVYLLGAYWPILWFLLALTPIATAIYDTRGKTVLVAVGVSIILFLIQASKEISTVIDWGQQAAASACIIFLSLMINDLVDSRRG